MKPLSVWIGYDAREDDAYEVCRSSIARRLSQDVPITPLVRSYFEANGLYRRPTETRDGRLWDVISGAPMATEFAITRFLTPILAETGWALFMDADMLVRADLMELFALADDTKAVMVVKHNQKIVADTKMDGQAQVAYPRKNWSSVMLFNCDHPANEALTIDLVNTLPGRDLHRFCWLPDELIGELPVEWNWLAGYSDPSIDPKIVHFTDGIPRMPGYENAPYADEWRAHNRPHDNRLVLTGGSNRLRRRSHDYR